MVRLICLAALSTLAVAWQSDDPRDAKKDGSNGTTKRLGQRALEPLNDWVGAWRGVGQPKRGSNKGAWTEEAEWAWKLDRDSAALQLEVKEGKQLQGGLLKYEPTDKKFRLVAKLQEGESRVYTGERGDEGKLTLTSSGDAANDQHRLTFQMRHEDRLLLLIEIRPAGQTTFTRVAEIGYTRKGGSFASAADSGPKCIVTGGRGSISLEYKGKTYYVCCTGCKAAFLDDPDGIIAEAAERAKKVRSEREK
jgi:YHS domain-containing protein